jgi:DNA invertase Pin-like site-specific DNA recombinase
MRAVLYCRVSSIEQTKNLSLATQEKACREYCVRNGYDVDRVFIDAGESAKTTDRPEFKQLLDHCRRGRGRLHAVIVYSLTRFSRNSTDHHAIAGLLRGLGITLRSVTEPIDESPSGRFMEGILAAMAQFDNDVRSERVTVGMRANVDRGRWPFLAPIGYLNTGNARPSLVPDPERAPAIRAAFELYDRGVTGAALRRQLEQLGLRTRHGHRLSGGTLSDILRNPVYVGQLRTKLSDATGAGDWTPLVDEALWTRVQARLRAWHTAYRPELAAHGGAAAFPL